MSAEPNLFELCRAGAESRRKATQLGMRWDLVGWLRILMDFEGERYSEFDDEVTSHVVDASSSCDKV